METFLPLGVYADTGTRLPAIDEETLESFAGEPAETEVSRDQLEAKQGWHLGLDDGFDPKALSECGWAVLYAPGTSEEVKKALSPLIEHRRKQVNNDRLFKVFEGVESYAPGETAAAWLAKGGKNIEMRDVNPRKGVPYYVMIVGGPAEVPFEFQYGLDLFWAVGRLSFPTAAEYGRYAESVVAYETAAQVPTSRQMAVFAPRNGDDAAMGLFHENVVLPMQASSEIAPAFGEEQRFRRLGLTGEAATKEALEKIWLGKVAQGPPAVVFTGSHGMVFYAGDDRQVSQQGAIICEEWRGVDAPKASHYFPASDLPANAQVHGMVHFLFDCYGAGWPRNDTFARTSKRPPKIAEAPTVARLPQALLAHRNGGALAVLGHVDRAWSSSYRSKATGSQIDDFRSVMNRLMAGHCVGHATDRLNQRWSTLSIDLAEQLQRKANELPVDAEDLKGRWIARDDARNYVVLGDPAVRLRVQDMPEL